jgi:hypothetical protein
MLPLTQSDLTEDYAYVVSSSVVRDAQHLLQIPRLSGASSAWQDRVQNLRSTILTFKKLETNWDSYGARPLSPPTITNALLALKILSMRSLIPFRVSAAGDDSILFECAVNNGKLLVAVGPDEEVGVVWKKKGEAQLYDTPLSYLADTISKLEDERL